MRRRRETARQRRRREQETAELIEATEQAGNPDNWTRAELQLYLETRGCGEVVRNEDDETLREAVRQDIETEADDLPWEKVS